MRVHLPALLALVSAATYVACGSSDNSKVDQEGGAGGEAGESTGAGGTQSTGASQNSGGTQGNPQAGEGGMLGVEAGAGGMAPVGMSGAGGEASLGGAGGEGGAGENPINDGFPSACPGVIGDYTLADGTENDDTITLAQQVGKVLSHTFAGNDTFEATYDGNDCLLGGLGDDDFHATGETASYLIGGSGADTFHITGSSPSSMIVDLAAEDTIALDTIVYNFLGSAVGEQPPASNFEIVPAYEAGTGMANNGEGSVMIYDPDTGKLWIDYNRGGIDDGSESHIATVLNHDSYTVTVDDFELE